MLASRTVLLQHQVTEMFKQFPAQIAEQLQQQYKQALVVATRESVVRQVNPTKNFALMSFEH